MKSSNQSLERHTEIDTCIEQGDVQTAWDKIFQEKFAFIELFAWYKQSHNYLWQAYDANSQNLNLQKNYVWLISRLDRHMKPTDAENKKLHAYAEELNQEKLERILELQIEIQQSNFTPQQFVAVEAPLLVKVPTDDPHLLKQAILADIIAGKVQPAWQAIHEKSSDTTLLNEYRRTAYICLWEIFRNCPDERTVQQRYAWLIKNLDEKINAQQKDAQKHDEDIKLLDKIKYTDRDNYNWAQYEVTLDDDKEALEKLSGGQLQALLAYDPISELKKLQTELQTKIDKNPASLDTQCYIQTVKKTFVHFNNPKFQDTVKEAEKTIESFQKVRVAIEKTNHKELKKLLTTEAITTLKTRPFTQLYNTPLDYAKDYFSKEEPSKEPTRRKISISVKKKKLPVEKIITLLESRFAKAAETLPLPKPAPAPAAPTTFHTSQEEVATQTASPNTAPKRPIPLDNEPIGPTPLKRSSTEDGFSHMPNPKRPALELENLPSDTIEAAPSLETLPSIDATEPVQLPETFGFYEEFGPLSNTFPESYGAMPSMPATELEAPHVLNPVAETSAPTREKEKFANRLTKLFKEGDGAWHLLAGNAPNKFVQKHFEGALALNVAQFANRIPADYTAQEIQHKLNSLIEKAANDILKMAQTRYVYKAEQLQKVFTDIHNNLSDEGLTALKKNQRDQVRALVKEKNTLDEPIVGGSGIGINVAFETKEGESNGVAWLTGVLKEDKAGAVPAAWNAKCTDDTYLREYANAEKPVWKIVAAAPTAAALNDNPVNTIEDVKRLVRGYDDTALSGQVCLKIVNCATGEERITQPIQRNMLNEKALSTHDIVKATKNALTAEKDTCIAKLKEGVSVEKYVMQVQEAQTSRFPHATQFLYNLSASKADKNVTLCV